MEQVTIKISKELLQLLVDSDAITTADFDVKYVNEDSVDYSDNETWQAQRKVSDKAFRKLKEIEFNHRHNGNSSTSNSRKG